MARRRAGRRWQLLVLAASLLGAGLTLPATASADSSGATPCPDGTVNVSLQFTAASMTVPVGGVTVPVPPVTAICDGVVVPLSNTDLFFTVTSSPSSVTLNSGWRSLDPTLAPGEGAGSEATPSTVLVTGGLVPATFTVLANYGSFAGEIGVTSIQAALPGTVTGHLLSIGHPRSNVHWNGAGCRRTRPVMDNSKRCVAAAVAAVNGARHREHLGVLRLPSNWSHLSAPQQLFVVTNLERTARDLPPITELATNLDKDAQTAAALNLDPFFQHVSSGSDGRGGGGWAGGPSNAIMAAFGWMYDDGLDANGKSTNIDCSRTRKAGCWGHRDGILTGFPTSGSAVADADPGCYSPCAAGVGYVGNKDVFASSFTEEFDFGTDGPQDPLAFSWSKEIKYLPVCERTTDTCRKA